MIIKNGKTYKTIAEAAREFGGVSAKTVREWISKGIIPIPPTLDQGVRTIAYFPTKYMDNAKKQLRLYREMKNQKKKGRDSID